jgi:hypothetical protein
MKLARIAFLALFSTGPILACGWDPRRPFEREAPEVKEAITHLDGGDAGTASELLEEYLTTGACKEGSIGAPPRVRARPNGAFDLGLGLFDIAQMYGRRFGEEEANGQMPRMRNDPDKQTRSENVECALRIVRVVGEDASQPADLRARARYLEGNLLFLNGAYEDAVKAYDRALEMAPGSPEAGVQIGSGRNIAGDAIGRDAAWNRAIALRRIDDKKDAGRDAQKDSSGEGGDNGDDQKKDQDDKNKKDGGDDGGNNDDKPDGGNDDQKKPPEQQKQTRQNQDERMLDQLENAPTVQQEAAKKMRKANPRGVLVDK